ncbi:putative tetratricopeptide repeat protein 32 [Apostichopus japonicus]|uniref:Putative tetratricopeptide repeat protein 32 n=1 Tax=Stichopus japonicus TaxID=307972 RepID=A0A2G8L1Q8_STIJA|nr:putative tetratricopeptide repeat protein 32 [Apostichopus japonicus]
MAVSADVRRLLQEGEEFFKLGKMKFAEEKFSEVIVKAEEKMKGGQTSLDSKKWMDLLGNAYNHRGQIKYLRVDFDEAIEDYTQALGQCPDFAVALYNRGQIHYRLGRFQQGIDDFKEALQIQPDFPDARLALKTAEQDLAASLIKEGNTI